jgi:hypothetical protein
VNGLPPPNSPSEELQNPTAYCMILHTDGKYLFCDATTNIMQYFEDAILVAGLLISQQEAED